MEKLRRLKKAKVMHGKSLRVNLKLSDAGLKFFDEIKKLKACKTSAEVFDYILDVAELVIAVTEKFSGVVDLRRTPQTRKIFTINEYSLARLRNVGKKINRSLDEVVDFTLLCMWEFIEEHRKAKEDHKYSEKAYVIKTIDDICGDIESLRHGLDFVFKQEYESYDPENFNYWFARIDGGMQGVRDLAEKLFDRMTSEPRDRQSGNGEGGKA